MIHPIHPTDYEELLAVWESSVKATHHFLSPEDFTFYKELIPTFFGQVKLFCVKDGNGAIAGFAGTSEENLEMLFVAANQRGKGYGKQLLYHALEKQAVTKVDVNQQNVQAVEFYEHLGFETKQISETDGFGKPYPILHLELFSD